VAIEALRSSRTADSKDGRPHYEAVDPTDVPAVQDAKGGASTTRRQCPANDAQSGRRIAQGAQSLLDSFGTGLLIGKSPQILTYARQTEEVETENPAGGIDSIPNGRPIIDRDYQSVVTYKDIHLHPESGRGG